mmetsp:Transcript_19188/g.32957  ORF Transcript_19188/g.32957 Transcript_19188/m.32957 type:complete len:190 (-) Transcript_19188:99-668(-)|eukprot:CAMPEP_0196665826 /NCGR_PEP_ID=MMETSP1086-20130531/62704_1 /TAXON_ID=77921 /ORGANISM="Cyanoptyche  gloeocystis , Strain SAG4.97" /LENGTH=189 /DNA_ID=CAMNT_0042002779 /DNA_START=166 /DNA_END=735 /DNA_ORIENTATION=+
MVEAEISRAASSPSPIARETKLLDHILRLQGQVVSGFQRGSKLLGIPTANLPYESFKEAVEDARAGVYFGWARVGNREEVYKAVLSIGWNPYFKNSQKTVEPYLLHKFEQDFYGEELRLLVCGFIRTEADFPSLDELIKAIHEDIRVGGEALDLPTFKAFKNDLLFVDKDRPDKPILNGATEAPPALVN